MTNLAEQIKEYFILMHENTITAEEWLEAKLYFLEFQEVALRHGWDYPHAAFCHEGTFNEFMANRRSQIKETKALREAAQENKIEFDEMCGYFCEMPLPQYVAGITLMNNCEGVLSDPEEFWCLSEQLKLTESQEIQFIIYARKCLSNPKALQLADAYAVAKQCAINGTEEDIFALFAAVALYKRDMHKIGSSIAKAGIQELLEKGCTTGFILEKYIEAREILARDFYGTRTTKIKDVTNPTHYIAKALKRNYKINVGFEDALNKAYEYFCKTQDPAAFLDCLLYASAQCDQGLERGVLLHMFAEVASEGKVLIMDPAPGTIRAWEAMMENVQTVYCVRTEYEKIILQHIFENAEFVSREELRNQAKEVQDVKEKVCYQAALIYWRLDNQCGAWNWLLTSDLLAEDARVELFVPNTILNQDQELRNLLAKQYHCRGLFLLPKELTKMSVKRWAICLGQRGQGNADGIYVKHMEEVKINGENWLAVTQDERPIVMCGQDLMEYREIDEKETILRLATHKRKQLNSSGTVRHKTKEFAFSKEISFFYRIEHTKNGKDEKVVAYVKEYPTGEQYQRGSSGKECRDSRSKKTLKTADQEAEIIQWLKGIMPYDERVRNVVVEVIKKGKDDNSPLLNRQMTLKTIWYCHVQNIGSLQKNGEEPEREEEKWLMETEVGEMAPETALEEFQTTMARLETTNGWDPNEKRNYWKCLNKLIEQAKQYKYCESNPIRSYIHEAFDVPAKAQRGLSVLREKTLTENDMKELFGYLLEGLEAKDYRYLSVLIRLLTGLEASVVAALRWEDLKQIRLAAEIGASKSRGFGQLLVKKQVSKDGKSLRGLRSEEDYRRVPIMQILNDVLLRRKKEVSKMIGTGGQNIEKMYVCWTDREVEAAKGLKDETAWKLPQTKDLQAAARDAVQWLKLDASVVHTFDVTGASKETDLSQYGGDFLRINFQYYCHFACQMDQSEEDYLLGLVQKTTYGKHYCDFTNEFVQAQMYYKLERWEASLLSGNLGKVKSETLQPRDGSYKWVECAEGGCTCALIEVKASRPVGVDISLQSLCGFEVQVKQNGGKP